MGADRSPWLRAAGLSKVYGGVCALEAATLEVRPGEIRGLVGANGAGKSTLVKILTGLVSPSAGEVLVDGRPLPLGRPRASLRAGIASVPQELTVAPTMTVAENVMLGHEPRSRGGRLRGREMRRAAADVFASLSLDISVDELVGRLPLIEQRLVMIARALSLDARLVSFDEPTATASPLEVELLLRAIRALSRRDVSVLYVSHRLDEIEALCESVTVLRDGRIVAELAGASRGELVGLLASGADETGRRGGGERRQGSAVLEIRELEGDRLRSVGLSVRSSEIVGLAGLSGSGARELLLTVCGAVPFTSGTVRLAGRALPSGDPVSAVEAGVGFLPGDRSLAVFPSHSVRHNVSIAAVGRHARWIFVRRSAERSAVAELLGRVALPADPEASISSLSGGNQQKAIVARWIASGATVLLLDDPTAGVDVATRPEIHGQIRELRDAGAAVLLVSTDVDELVDLADRVVTFDRGAVIDELAGAELTPPRLLAAMTGGALHHYRPEGGSAMSQSETDKQPAAPAPLVAGDAPDEIADGVWVIPDRRVDLVPNVGIVVGERAALVVDTAMGRENGERVLAKVRELTGRKLILTVSHFHPEHGFGAQAFQAEATIVYNEVQREELGEKFSEFVEMFSGFSGAVAELLSDVELVFPHVSYRDEADIDLGGRVVQLRQVGPAHTRGDQVIFLPEERILFAGDLVENRFFPILPDADAHGSKWIDLLARLEALEPAVVVPGHGEVGDAGLIRDVRAYLETLRSMVWELAGEGRSLEEIEATLEPEIRERYASWDNPMWITFAIDSFHGELGA